MTGKIIDVLLSIAGGGSLVVIFQAIINRRKNKADVTDVHVKTALELEKIAVTRYVDMVSQLDTAQGLIDSIRRECEVYKWCYERAVAILKENKLDYPKPEFPERKE